MLDGQNGDIVILMELICSGERRAVINIACRIVLSARRKIKSSREEDKKFWGQAVWVVKATVFGE